MIIFKKAQELTKYLQTCKEFKRSIGFVPTMGALHGGHLSLISNSNNGTAITVCSIFVNPVQFNNREDFEKYPHTLEQDIRLLEENGCDILFLPSEAQIYPDQDSKNKNFDLGDIETILEGEFRPGHFQGVALVMERLLNIVQPDMLFLGQKDFQQCLVIEKLAEIMQSGVQIIKVDTLREESGLARSSRNLRLTPQQRVTAAKIFEELTYLKDQKGTTGFSSARQAAIGRLEKFGFKIDYIALMNADNFTKASNFDPNQRQILLIAAFLGNVRLIDNMYV